jgi:hypothetical protein
MRAIGRHATAPGSELCWRANPLRSLRFRATGIDAVRPFQHVCGRLAGGYARQQRPLSASVPPFMTAPAASTAVAKHGAQSRARPISSSTTH